MFPLCMAAGQKAEHQRGRREHDTEVQEGDVRCQKQKQKKGAGLLQGEVLGKGMK